MAYKSKFCNMRRTVIKTHLNNTVCKHSGRSWVTEIEPLCLGIGLKMASAHSYVIFPVLAIVQFVPSFWAPLPLGGPSAFPL